MSIALPRELERVEIGTAQIVALPPLAVAMRGLVERHGTVYAWAAKQPQPRTLRGRAPVYVVTFKGVAGRFVVRHAWHGGALAPLTRDLFLPPTRAEREMMMSAALRDAGVPTTECAGFVRYRALGGLYRIDTVTRYVDDATDLGSVLAESVRHPSGGRFAHALDATTEMVTVLSRARFTHPDLNAKNVLIVARDDTVRPQALVIDVDVVEHHSHLDDRVILARNAQRLLRSLRKLARAVGMPSDEQATQFASLAEIVRVSSGSTASPPARLSQ